MKDDTVTVILSNGKKLKLEIKTYLMRLADEIKHLSDYELYAQYEKRCDWLKRLNENYLKVPKAMTFLQWVYFFRVALGEKQVFDEFLKARGSGIEEIEIPPRIKAEIDRMKALGPQMDNCLANEDRVVRAKLQEVLHQNRALKCRLSLKIDPDPNQLKELIEKARHPRTGRFSYRKLGRLLGCTHSTAKNIVKRAGLEHLTAD